jgi:hypothetical protein
MLINFMRRGTWSIHCLADDAKTPVSGWVTVRDDSTLLRLFRACGASKSNIAEIQRDMARWGRGSTWLALNETGRRLLRVRG